MCWAKFQGQEKGNAAPAALQVAVSRDGGATWSSFSPVVGPVHQPGLFDPVQGSSVIDGIAGARSDLAPAPSVDIANGAPTGAGATDHMVLSSVSSTAAGDENPHVYLSESSNRGVSWTTPQQIETSNDRGFYAAPAISPNGSTVYVVYNAFTTPYQTSTGQPRLLVGVVKQGSVSSSGVTGSWTELHRGVPGDARGSSANSLTSEFLGDYVYAAATRTFGLAVWNDARNAAHCTAVDTYRQNLELGITPNPTPNPPTACLGPESFGNSDIYSFSSAP